jgi:hypothetical protein
LIGEGAVDGGFTGRFTKSLTFTATEANETLSFLAIGTCLMPGNTRSPTDPGSPPFALLDSVELTAAPAPEPSTWAMMALGFAGLGFVAHRGRAKALQSVATE